MIHVSAVHILAMAGIVSNQVFFVQPTSVCCKQSNSLELGGWWPAWSRPQHHQFRSPGENASVSAVFSAPRG